MREKLTSPFWKLRHFAFSKQGSKEAPAAIDERPLTDVAKSLQDAMDMRLKYEGLLANGQIISGAAYDFSRSLQDMASYMVESFGEVADKEIGNMFSLLAKVQFEMSKLLDLFSAHVSKAIIKPTELMMNKIQQAEIMKNEYDEKRKLYILSQMEKQKGKSKRGKGSLGHQKTLMAEESIQEQANLLTLYMQSLTRGQSEHLVTQAVKYHSAHMHLFSKGFASINAIEPMITQVALDRIVDRTLSEEESSIDDFMYNSEMNTEGKVQKNNSETDSAASSSRHLVIEQTEPPGYLSDSSEEFYPRKSAVNSKSAPISPLMYHRREPMANSQETLDSEHERVARYALPSPLNGSRRWVANKIIKCSDINLSQTENDTLEVSQIEHNLDMPLNEFLLHSDQSIQAQKHGYSETKSSPNKRLFFADVTEDVCLNKPSVEKGRRYTQSGPLVDSPSAYKASQIEHNFDMPLNEFLLHRDPSIQVQKHGYSETKSSPNKRFFFTDVTEDVCLNKPSVEKGRRYTQSGPLVDSPSSGGRRYANVRRTSPTAYYEEHTPPLYKSGPISRSPLFSYTTCNLSPPPSSMPSISELHKLPLPPPGFTTPPKSPNHTPSPITYSAPLGKAKLAGFCESGSSSTPGLMIRSLSIPTPTT